MSANLKRGCGILLIASVVLLSILALLPDADVDHDAGTEKRDQNAPVNWRHVCRLAHQVKEHHGHEQLEDKLRERPRHLLGKKTDLDESPA